MIKQFLQGRFMKHPLHPALVHIPIGLWTGSLIFDLLFMSSASTSLAVTSYFCMLAGIISALLATPSGIAEWLDIPEKTKPRTLATTHMILNFVVVALYIVNFFFRFSLTDGIPNTVPTNLFVLSLASIVVLGISGYIGGLLVYDHGIGIHHDHSGRLSPNVLIKPFKPTVPQSEQSSKGGRRSA